MTAAERIGLDWSGSKGVPPATVGEPRPCKHCGRPALLREPGHPRTSAHKICSERALAAKARELSERAV